MRLTLLVQNAADTRHVITTKFHISLSTHPYAHTHTPTVINLSAAVRPEVSSAEFTSHSHMQIPSIREKFHTN